MDHYEMCNNATDRGIESQSVNDVAVASTGDESMTKISNTCIDVVEEEINSSSLPPRDVILRSNENNDENIIGNINNNNNYCGLQMREQDADWLEAMHINGGPNKTGMTPVLTSASQRSIYGTNDPPEEPSTFSLLTESGDDSDVVRHEQTLDGETTSVRSGPQSPTVKNKNKLLHYLPNNSPKIKTAMQTNDENFSAGCNDAAKTISIDLPVSHVHGCHETIQNFVTTFRNSSHLTSEDVTGCVPLMPLRRPTLISDRPVLSGTIYEDGITSSANDNQPTTSVDESDADAKVSLPLQAMTSREAFIASSDHSVFAKMQRDGYKSDDDEQNTDAKERRKITEVAQFVDAVGDNALDVQIIEDDDDDQGHAAHGDDDDDDDATEIHVHQQQRNVIGGLLPIKMRSSTNNTHPTANANPKPTPRMDSTVPLADVSLRVPIALDEFPETPIKARPYNVEKCNATIEKFSLHSDTIDSIRADATILNTINSSSPSRNGFLAQLPTSASMCTTNDFVYKGIGANPPEIVKRGTTRGNYAQLHRKAWLEVTDKYHRYGKNLRLYYRYWESEGHPTNIFFDWLDSKGDAAGNELPELKECPRRQLDSDTVLYINNPDVTQGYAIHVSVQEMEKNQDSTGTDRLRRGRMYDIDGHPVCTGPDGWIFVLRDNILYGAKKITSVSGQSRQRFHHSSFFGGKAVVAAGIFITDDDGYLTRLYPHSGHYRPGEAHMQRVLFYLYHEGVDLRSFEMDTQQIMHVARDGIETTKEKNMVKEKIATEKKKKVEALHLMPAVYIACFLAHKARFIGEGIFAQIHQIRQSDVASVSEALSVIDHGGFWNKEK